jgi:predicted permease
VSGVAAAGGVSALPLSEMMSWGPVTVEGRIPPPGEKFINVDQRIVGGGYFEAMRIPLRAGRLFAEQDLRTQPRVAVVDELMAQQLWPGLEPVGRRIRLGGADSTTPWVTVVGVVGRVKQDRLDADSRMAMYIPHAQFPTRAMNLVLRSATADPGSLTLPATAEIRRTDPDLPVYNIRTMDDRVGESLARRRFSTLLMTLFAGLALGLAAIGIYSVIAYIVSQGAREIGIRIALGASPAGILLLVVRHGAGMAGLGIAIGTAAALALAPMMRTMLFGVDPFDPATFATIAGLLALVALAASAVPGLRASRIDPVVTLRAE